MYKSTIHNCKQEVIKVFVPVVFTNVDVKHIEIYCLWTIFVISDQMRGF